MRIDTPEISGGEAFEPGNGEDAFVLGEKQEGTAATGPDSGVINIAEQILANPGSDSDAHLRKMLAKPEIRDRLIEVIVDAVGENAMVAKVLESGLEEVHKEEVLEDGRKKESVTVDTKKETFRGMLRRLVVGLNTL